MWLMGYLNKWSVVAAIAVLSALAAFSCAPQRPVVPASVMVQPVEAEALADTGPKDDPAMPVAKLIPATPEPWQKRPPCDEEQDERLIGGACWQATSRRPPCGTLYRHQELCVRPIAKAKPRPVSEPP